MSVGWRDGEEIDWEAYHQRLRAGIRIEDVLSLLGVQLPTRRPRNGYKVLCPVHGEKKPSMHVYSDDNKAWCYGACGKGYDVIELVAAVKRIRFIEAADWLGDRFGIGPNGSGNQDAEQIVIAQPRQKRNRGEFPPLMDANRARLFHRQLTDREYDWFEKERLIPRWFVDVILLGHTMRGEWPPAFVIPVWGREIGELVTMRFRLDDTRPLDVENQPEEKRDLIGRRYWGITDRNGVYPFGVWGLPKNADWVVLCEAELDTLALLAFGIPAVTLTVGASGNHLWREWERFLLPYDKWIVVLDDDDAGHKATDVMRTRWPTRVIPFSWPPWEWNGVDDDGNKRVGDVTDFLKVFGHDEFVERIDVGLRRHSTRNDVAISTDTTRMMIWRGWSEVGQVAWVG